MRRLGWIAASIALATVGCSDDLEAGGDGIDAGAGEDPLVFDEPAEAGSLEELQRDIIQERCSGERGLCHNGQFEPNLSTTANTYAWLVRRPAIENFGKLRVDPNTPANSFLIDKLRDRNGVSTQMPLGADPLSEEDIGRFEAWISGGALRRPGAEPPTVLNNPPRQPETAVFIGTTRVDRVGTYSVPANTTLNIRHTVEDFETADENMFLGALIIGTQMGNVALAANGGDLAATTFDTTNPPMGTADVLNFEFDFALGATTDVVTAAGVQTVPTDQLTFTPIALYIDLEPAAGGIVALRLPDSSFTVQ